MQIHFKISDKKTNARAVIDEYLNIISTDEVLQSALQVETDFAKTQQGYFAPPLLVLFQNLKATRGYKITPSKGALRALKKKIAGTVIC